MGRYASYGIVTTFRISLSRLDKAIRSRFPNKSLKDCDLGTVISQFPLDLYDVRLSDDYLTFDLKDTIKATDIVNLMRDFFRIYPHKFEDTEELCERLAGMTIEEMKDFARQKEEEHFNFFVLYGYLYRMKVEVDGYFFYIATDVCGFKIVCSYDKIVAEDDTEPFGFITELLRYRLLENPLSKTLLSFLSQ